MKLNRRNLLAGFGSVSGGLILSGCSNANEWPSSAQREEAKGGEVTATEDLMREHGVLRRALLVYSEAATRLHSNPSAVAPDVLQKTARLFRAFGEDGFENAVRQIADIENEFGLADLAQFTAPRPPSI